LIVEPPMTPVISEAFAAYDYSPSRSVLTLQFLSNGSIYESANRRLSMT
jgi:hypothetical protein